MPTPRLTNQNYQKTRNRIKAANQNGRPPGVAQCLLLLTDNTEPRLKESIDRRVALIDKAHSDLAFRAAELEKCKKDVVYWVNNWVWTFDPRRTPSTLPFDLFAKQEEYLQWLGDRVIHKESGVVEKSRDAGLTWLCGAWAIHRWLFYPGQKFTFASRKESLVDRIGDPDSIFEKFRFLLKGLPKWMLPKRYSTGFLKFINSENGSVIGGESGDNIGRGGRSGVVFLDEFAFVERAQRVDAAVSENSDVIIYISTPNGPGNAFAKKRFSGVYQIFRIHWTDDPRKGKDWYERKKKILDPIILAQEIDIDYNASVEGVCIPALWVQAAIGLVLESTSREKIAGLDVAAEGANKNVFIVRQGQNVIRIDAWAIGNTTQTAYKAKAICEDEKIARLNFDGDGVGAGVGGTLASVTDLRFDVQPIRGGGQVSDKVWVEFNDRESSEIFKNLRAEMWWSLRLRFEKTYEYVNNLALHPIDELISLPNEPELIAQLSLPLYHFTDSGLLVIESKEQMKKRGISSPDYADALAYAFAPVSGYDVSWLKNC